MTQKPETLRDQIERLWNEHFWYTYPPGHAREMAIVIARLCGYIAQFDPEILNREIRTTEEENQLWLRAMRQVNDLEESHAEESKEEASRHYQSKLESSSEMDAGRRNSTGADSGA